MTNGGTGVPRADHGIRLYPFEGCPDGRRRPMIRRHPSCGHSWGYFVTRLHRLDQGERLAALTLLAVCLFNVYEFINVG
jgi:hypothetical protein